MSLHTALRDLVALCHHANDGAWKNDVTDSSGTIDEGEVRARDILDEAENALSQPELALTLGRFQYVNVQRCIEAFKHPLDSWSLLEWAGAMCGEAGEAANISKKILRKVQGIGGKWTEKDPDCVALISALGDEIADTLAYLSLLAAAAGLDLATCAAKKFDEVSDTLGWPGQRLLPSPTPDPRTEHPDWRDF